MPIADADRREFVIEQDTGRDPEWRGQIEHERARRVCADAAREIIEHRQRPPGVGHAADADAFVPDESVARWKRFVPLARAQSAGDEPRV